MAALTNDFQFVAVMKGGDDRRFGGNFLVDLERGRADEGLADDGCLRLRGPARDKRDEERERKPDLNISEGQS